MGIKGLLWRIFPNAAWDLCKWLWVHRDVGVPIAMTILVGVYRHLQSQPFDFWLLIVVCVGSALMVLLVNHRESRSRGSREEEVPRCENLVLPLPVGIGAPQWSSPSTAQALRVVSHLKRDPPKLRVKILAGGEGREIADLLVLVFDAAGWLLQKNPENTLYVFPFPSGYAISGILVRYCQSPLDTSLDTGLVALTVVVALRQLFPEAVEGERVYDSDLYDFIQIEVGSPLSFS